MAFDLRKALLRKGEHESARLMDFEFRHRARTFRLMAEVIGVDAEAVVKRIDVSALTKSLGCSQATAECGTQAIAALGRRLYRRPLSQRETDAMLTVFNAALAEQLIKLAGECSVRAREELIREIGDPTPNRLL